jgi:hypothetical protein
MHPALKSVDTALVELPAGMETALSAVLRAYDYAREFRRNVWDFAVTLQELLTTDFTSSDLRWLAYRGYVEHAVETTPDGARERSFRPSSRGVMVGRTCVVLTETGAKFARGRRLRRADRLAHSPRTIPLNGHAADCELGLLPCWDESRRQLLLGDRVVKYFRQPAPNQEAVLSAFEEEGWPPRIDDPLPPPPGGSQREHLHNTIMNLNRYQRHRTIRFFGDGNGQGVCWEFIAADGRPKT